MSRLNGVVIYSLLLMILVSVFSQRSLVCAFPVRQLSSERPDPLRKFKPYNGTYDIRNKHYWASAAFTGVHGYAMAGIWLLFGLGFGGYMILKNCNRDYPPVFDYSDSSYVVIFSLIVLFTLLAIVASGVIIAFNRNFLLSVRKLKETVSHAGFEAFQSLQRVINVMVQMRTHLQPYDSKTCQLLNSTSHRLRRESTTVQHVVDQIKHSSDEVVETLYVGNLVVAIANLVLLIAALVLIIMHSYPGILIIILCCWILTTLTWFLTGLDFFSQIFAEDTCSALEAFEQHPQNNSLQIILPCGDSNQSKEMMVEIGSTVHNFIFQINTKISESLEVLGFEEGKNNMVRDHEICNPFSGAPSYSYRPEGCPENAFLIGDLPEVLSRFTCYQENSTGDCRGDGRFIPESFYVLALAYSQSIQDLLTAFPDLLKLTHCSAVKEAFYDIVHHQCAPFRSSTRIIWTSMLCLSIIMVVLVFLWIAKAFQDRGRIFSVFSITPETA